VNVYRKHRPIARKEQSASDSLGANAFKASKELSGIIEGRLSQKRQIERLASPIYFVQQVLNPDGLLSGQAS
jgi:hypothetical protein